jgi:predicted RNase H-like HicB family nuclease
MDTLKKRYSYIAILDYAEDGINIEFPDLPGCYSCADKDDTDMALKNAKEALGVHLFGMEQDGDPIPEPTPLTDIHYETGQLPVLIEVFMPPIRDRIRNRFVKKTISLPAWMSSEADEYGINCSKFFQTSLGAYLETLHKSNAPVATGRQ